LEFDTEIFTHLLAPLIHSPKNDESVQKKQKHQVSSSDEDPKSPMKKVTKIAWVSKLDIIQLNYVFIQLSNSIQHFNPITINFEDFYSKCIASW